MAEHFLKHMSAQLAFYLACILFKKAKKDSTQWKICSKMSGPLLLMAHQAQLPEDNVAWLKDLPNTLANTCKLWIKDGHLRKSQAGNILLGLNSKKKFMDSISPMLVTKWQDELYKVTFFKALLSVEILHNDWLFCRKSSLIPKRKRHHIWKQTWTRTSCTGLCLLLMICGSVTRLPNCICTSTCTC